MANFRWFNDKQVRDARAQLHDAEDALEKNSRKERAAGVKDETDEYLRLNHAVHDARANLRQARP